LTKVILVRHGQTDWNHLKRYQGHSDISLNQAGLSQAQRVAERLAGQSVQAVYSSDLLRAVQTAEAIAEKQGLTVIPLTEFREINFGSWEGLTYVQIMAEWPDLLTAIYSRPGDIRIPGGESFQIVQQRAMAALTKCVERHREQTSVMVAHGGSLRAMLCAALGMELDEIWSIGQDSTAVRIVEYSDDKAEVIILNDISHLE